MRELFEVEDGRATTLGWYCACGAFNGTVKEQLTACRCCGQSRGRGGNVTPAERLKNIAASLLLMQPEDIPESVVSLSKEIEEVAETIGAPVPLVLTCPVCGERHLDEGEFATKPHRDHACQKCGLTWRPAKIDTVGVRFLPGYKNGTPT